MLSGVSLIKVNKLVSHPEFLAYFFNKKIIMKEQRSVDLKNLTIFKMKSVYSRVGFLPPLTLVFMKLERIWLILNEINMIIPQYLLCHFRKTTAEPAKQVYWVSVIIEPRPLIPSALLSSTLMTFTSVPEQPCLFKCIYYLFQLSSHLFTKLTNIQISFFCVPNVKSVGNSVVWYYLPIVSFFLSCAHTHIEGGQAERERES